MTFPLVCLGNPLLDLQSKVDFEYLSKYGLKENDAILAGPEHAPIFGEVLQKDDLQVIAGGAAQNTARGAQYILPPHSVVYFGSVGQDVYAEKLNQANKEYGLRTEYQTHASIETGKCAVLLNGVNRSLVTDLAAANHFQASHLDKDENWELIEQATHYYIGGYHLTVSPEAIAKIGMHSSDNNKVCVLNFSAPFIPQFFKNALSSSLPFIDIVVANEAEAEAYSQANNLGCSDKDLVAIAKEVAKLPKANVSRPRIVIFTQGTLPTVTVTYDFSTESFDVQEYPVYSLDSSKIVDTNGAGDAFAAGLIASLVQGKDLNLSVHVGQWAAALSIQQVGPSFPFPKQTYA